MNTTIKRQGFGWGFLAIGLFFFVAALIVFRHPWANMLALAFLFGVLAILSGIWFLRTRYGSTPRLVVGILEIMLGVFFLANLGLTAAVIPFLFAVWFVANSISNLFLLPLLRPFGQGVRWSFLLLNALGILAGAMMLLEPMLSAWILSFIVGFYFLLVALGNFLLAFAQPNVTIVIDEE